MAKTTPFTVGLACQIAQRDLVAVFHMLQTQTRIGFLSRCIRWWMIIVRPNHTQFILIPFQKFWATEIREEEKINGIDYCIVMCFLKRLRAKYAYSACEIIIIFIVFDHSKKSRRSASCDLGLRFSALVAPMDGGCRPYLRHQPQSIETNTDLKKYPHT